MRLAFGGYWPLQIWQSKRAYRLCQVFVGGITHQSGRLLEGFWMEHWAKCILFTIHTILVRCGCATPSRSGSPMKKKMRNWLYYNYLSGDHIVEQAIHSIDMMSWVLGDVPPVRATGTGGRQSRVEPEYGNIFDHFAIVYEYGNGAKGFHFSRQQKGCSNSYAVEVMGDSGSAMIDCIRDRHSIRGVENWRYRGESNDMYQQEHDELFASIREGKPMNDGKWMAQSTMLGIMARMVAYTGQTLTYEEALNSEEVLAPDDLTGDTVLQDPPVAMPGITPFI
jgi:myo-inositol 2-dehydrogenase/D-chiro-inositol 1-dehydrogenase